MIAFRLDHMLHMQYDQMIQALLDGWTMGKIYAIHENEMIFLLENGQCRAYSFMENRFVKARIDDVLQKAISEVTNAPEEDKDFLFVVDSEAADICKFLILLIRRTYELKPFADRHMTQVLLAKLNKRLEKYKLQIGLDQDEYIMPSFLLNGELVTLEKALEAVRQGIGQVVKQQTTEVITKSIVQYIEVPTLAQPQEEVKEEASKGLDEVPDKAVDVQENPVGNETISTTDIEKDIGSFEVKKDVEPGDEKLSETLNENDSKIPENVRKLFESALNGAKPGTEVYHSICFAMGEIMYYRDELESAIYFYEKCEIDRIEDKEDFYERLGHCYLDDKMDAFASSLKLIYRAEHNAAYRESHKEELEKAPHFSKTEIAAYREKCISLGEEMYRKKSES